MSVPASFRLALDPSEILRAQGMTPDPWQREFLLSEDNRIMLLCTRGAGKTRVTSCKALHKAYFRPNSLILLVSRSQRQSMELFRYIKQAHAAVCQAGEPPSQMIRETMTDAEFTNGSRIVCLPGKEETIRGYQGVTLIIKDEAARIPDDMNSTLAPMLAISKGQDVSLTTPWGQRGWFWKQWVQDKVPAKRFKTTWRQCPRYNETFIQEEIALHGISWVKQEYECSFESLSGLVYPDFAEQAKYLCSPPRGIAQVGGIDFGYRNPFAAIWGTYSHDDILHIDGERYLREVTLNKHADALKEKAGVTWYADPAGAQEIASLRKAGMSVKKALNPIRAGIAAVAARLETGRLRITEHRCPNLFAEAQLYQWSDKNLKEEPVDDNNHALGALRYLIATIDRHFVHQYLRSNKAAGPERDRGPDVEETAEAVFHATVRRKGNIDLTDERLWTSVN